MKVTTRISLSHINLNKVTWEGSELIDSTMWRKIFTGSE